jgi:hypothetical protein
VAVIGICLVVLFAAGIVSGVVVPRLLKGRSGTTSESLAKELASASFSPYELVRKSNAARGKDFRRGLARAAERATRRTAPGSAVTFDDETTIDDLGTTMRGRVGYRGRAGGSATDPVQVEGEQRQFFHPNGMVIVDVVCLPALSSCERRDLLLDATEGAILEHLNAKRPDAMLPESGRCEIESNFMAGSLATCEFGEDGLVLTLQMLSLEETRRALNAQARTPDAGDPKARVGR